MWGDDEECFSSARVGCLEGATMKSSPRRMKRAVFVCAVVNRSVVDLGVTFRQQDVVV